MRRMLTSQLLTDHFPQQKMAFVVGPRQVGKTTIAEELLKKRASSDLYRNWDDLEWRRAISKEPYGFLNHYRARQSKAKPLVVLDEIHKFPRWKAYLKGLWDTRKKQIDLLVTGSGRLDVYQKGGDSLFGRYHQYRLHPLSVKEVIDPAPPSQNYHADETLKAWLSAKDKPPSKAIKVFRDLMQWGGFPEPFVKKNRRAWRLWQQERRRLLIREDLRDLTRIQLISHIEELLELLVPRAGKLLSYNALREDLQVALDSVRLWMGYLQRLYYLYYVRPYSKNIARALRREPKIYLWDWSEITNEGTRFENLMASHLLKWCHFTQDWGYEPLDLHFVRDKEKREVDFLITRNKQPWLLIEGKWSQTEPTRPLHYFAKQLGIKNKLLVVAQLDRPGLAGDVAVLDAATFFAFLPV